MADLLISVLVVCNGPDAFPHITWVIVIEVLLNVLLVPVFSQLDALFQFFTGPAIIQPVS